VAADPTNPPEGVPEEDLDELYHGPLADFTPRRNELAKKLRADGEREASDWVKGLRKPSQAAWIANQLAVRKPRDVERLLTVGEELRDLQERLLEGSADQSRLRDSAGRERQAIEKLVKEASSIAAKEKAGRAAVDRVGETLQAATVDPELAEALRLGRLAREQRASSLGLAGAAGPAPKRGASATRAAAKEEAKGKTKGGKSAARAAEERTRRELDRQRQAAERKIAAAERKVEKESASAEKAREALIARQRSLTEAQRALTEAKRELKRVR
jgi:hypothetical protein